MWRIHENHVDNNMWRTDTEYVDNEMFNVWREAYGDMN